MNLHEKLVEARLRFQNANIKMSGENSLAGYKYYELADILPAINQIAAELKFVCLVSFQANLAVLSIVDTEKPDAVPIIFTSPMEAASLKGCHAVQNLGAAQTYLKRYLYQHAFEIVEADVLNATHNPNEKAAAAQPVDSLVNERRMAAEVLKTFPEGSEEYEHWKARLTEARDDAAALKNLRHEMAQSIALY